MADTTLIPPEKEKTRPHYVTDPMRNVRYETIPPDITLRPQGIELKRPIFVGSVVVMIFFSFITFFVPFFSGLLGGTLGGYHAGRMKRALAAGVLASVVVPGLLAFLSFMSEQPPLLFLMGLTFREWIIAHILGTLVGAATGAFMRPHITDRELWEHRYA